MNKKNAHYLPSDFPTPPEKKLMWNEIQSHMTFEKHTQIQFHWKSFLIGNAAAILLIFSIIGIQKTAKIYLTPPKSDQERVYNGVRTATEQWDRVVPVIMQKANDQTRSSMESTLLAIREIDRLIEELKNEILINGNTPSKQSNLNRLYANKLDFYKQLLLTNQEQS